MRLYPVWTAVAFACLVNFSSAKAQQFDHCNAILDHGITDITTYLSEQHSLAFNWYTYCGSFDESTSDSRAREAAGSIFGYGGADASENASSIKKRVIQWCQANTDLAKNNQYLFEEARTINQFAVNAWNNCQENAKKGLVIKFNPQLEFSEKVHFEIDSTSDADYVYLGIEKDGFTCNERAVVLDADGNLSVVNEGEQAVGTLIRNANIHIDCTRSSPVVEEIEGVGTIEFSNGYLSIATSGPAFSIGFPRVVSDYFVTPRGAVLAFNSPVCPNGWTHFSAANGRVIVGAGNGEGLSDRPLGSLGGLENVPLSVAQMPPHTHSVNWGTAHSSGTGSYVKNTSSGPDTDNRHWTSTSTGGGEPHENMPPFIALTLCEKG